MTNHHVRILGITPSPFYQEKLCNLFGMTAEALELTNSPNTKSEQILVTTEWIPLDQSINDRLDHIESIINFAWEA